MDPNEIIKAAPEIAKGAAALAAAIPFTGIVKRMLGPAADELAEMWRDQVRLYRYQRQLKCVEKAERMAQEAGFTPQAVPPKILFPLLEGASFEENEDLHTMWAALLTNAASPENAGKTKPGFIATLKQMDVDEAAMLNWMFQQRIGRHAGPFSAPFDYANLMDAYASLGFVLDRASKKIGIDGIAFETCLQNLESEKLIEPLQGVISPGRITPRALTFRGLSFMFACRPPKAKE